MTQCVNHSEFTPVFLLLRWSQWPRSLRHGSAAASLLMLWVRIIFVSCECCVSSGRGLCVGVITCSEDSYRVWRVCNRKASTMRSPWSTRSCCAIGKNVSFLKSGRSKWLQSTYFISYRPRNILEESKLGFAKFFKNVGGTSKFQAPRRWHEASSTPITNK